VSATHAHCRQRWPMMDAGRVDRSCAAVLLLLGNILEEMLGEERDVIGTFASAELDGDNFESIKKILAEFSFLTIDGCRGWWRQHAHVYFLVFIAPTGVT